MVLTVSGLVVTHVNGTWITVATDDRDIVTLTGGGVTQTGGTE
jgi:hypothetical protein